MFELPVRVAFYLESNLVGGQNLVFSVRVVEVLWLSNRRVK